MAEQPAPIAEDLVAFLESGVSVLVGTRDERLRPTAARGMGVTVAPDRRSIAVRLPKALAAQTLANLRDDARAAVTFCRIGDNRAIQIKGRCVDVREGTEDDRVLAARYVAMFGTALEVIGVPRARSRFTHWPAVVIHVAAEQFFVQTPGPAAGRKVEPSGA
jgi:hypothetical protein